MVELSRADRVAQSSNPSTAACPAKILRQGAAQPHPLFNLGEPLTCKGRGASGAKWLAWDAYNSPNDCMLCVCMSDASDM